MKKRIVLLAMVAVLLSCVVFTACNKATYTDPSTGEEYMLVVDENGQKILSDTGELLVYATDENGKKIKDENGEYVTEIHGFVGQLESDGVIEDYAYYFTLPDGWKAVSDRGEFENKDKSLAMQIAIRHSTYNDYDIDTKKVYQSLLDEAVKNEIDDEYSATLETLDYKNVDTPVNMLVIDSEKAKSVFIYFAVYDNVFTITVENNGSADIEDMKAEAIASYEALKFKPYTYYEDLTDKPTETDGDVESEVAAEQ